MAKIIYFGTNGCPGHTAIGIDALLKNEEYKQWYECDNEHWIENVRKNPGRHLIKHHEKVYTNYGIASSVDDDRNMSHTELFWEGIHTEQEMLDLIRSNDFLRTQFSMVKDL